MGRKQIQCPDCGIFMFQSSLWKHQQGACKGVERQDEEMEFNEEYIRAMCLEIQKDWTDRERSRRAQFKRRVPWALPEGKTIRTRRGVDV